MAHWKKLRKRAAHRTKLFFLYWLARKKKEPVFLLASRRSGSNFLLGLLNSTGGADFASEVLHPDMYYGIRRTFISKKTVLNHIAHSLNACGRRICGAKLLLSQMQFHGLGISDLLERFPTARFIVLYRRSMVDQFLSLKLAERTGQWQKTEDQPAPRVAIRVDENELREFCRRTRADYEALLGDECLRERALVLDYETLSADPQKVFDETVFPWLGLPSSRVSSVFRRQSKKRAKFFIDHGWLMHMADEPWARQDHASQPMEAGAAA